MSVAGEDPETPPRSPGPDTQTAAHRALDRVPPGAPACLLCACGAAAPFAESLVCPQCSALCCPACSRDALAYTHCPQCLESMTQVEAFSHLGRCIRCMCCPLCSARAPFTSVRCSTCKWESREAAPVASSVSEAVAHLTEQVMLERERRSLRDAPGARAVAEVLQRAAKGPKAESDAARRARELERRAADVASYPSVDALDKTLRQRADTAKVCFTTIEQRISQFPDQPVDPTALAPLRMRLLPRITRSCPACATLLVEPPPQAAIVRPEEQRDHVCQGPAAVSCAWYTLPRMEVYRPRAPLVRGEQSALVVVLKNPQAKPLAVMLAALGHAGCEARLLEGQRNEIQVGAQSKERVRLALRPLAGCREIHFGLRAIVFGVGKAPLSLAYLVCLPAQFLSSGLEPSTSSSK
eukprot:m51a1_g13197 hypothetical protein (411) ;mRNA; r:327-2540